MTTVLVNAVLSQNLPEVVNLVQNYGRNLVVAENNQALISAVVTGGSIGLAAAKILLENGADPHARNDKTFELAIQRRDRAMVYCLLEYVAPDYHFDSETAKFLANKLQVIVPAAPPKPAEEPTVGSAAGAI